MVYCARNYSDLIRFFFTCLRYFRIKTVTFNTRADIKQYIGPPTEHAIFTIYHSCITELKKVSLIIYITQTEAHLPPLMTESETLIFDNCNTLFEEKISASVFDLFIFSYFSWKYPFEIIWCSQGNCQRYILNRHFWGLYIFMLFKIAFKTSKCFWNFDLLFSFRNVVGLVLSFFNFAYHRIDFLSQTFVIKIIC